MACGMLLATETWTDKWTCTVMTHLMQTCPLPWKEVMGQCGRRKHIGSAQIQAMRYQQQQFNKEPTWTIEDRDGGLRKLRQKLLLHVWEWYNPYKQKSPIHSCYISQIDRINEHLSQLSSMKAQTACFWCVL